MELIRRLAAFVLGLAMLAGTGIAVYLVWHHENEVYGDTAVDLGNCPQTETVNCEAVNSSEYSEVLGVPVAALAIPTYLVVLGLVAIGRRKPRGWGHAFGLGLAAVAFSGWLYYVSVTKIGFLCLWCLRLYAINASIPVLSAIAAWRSPLALLAESGADLIRWPADARRALVGFVALLAITVVVDRVYRASLQRPAQVPVTIASGAPSAPVAASESPAPGSQAPRPLRQMGFAPGRNVATNFELAAHVGKGRPVALLFWAPGFRQSELALQTISRWFREQVPAFELFAVSGRRDDQNESQIAEKFALLDVPADLPLLIDDGFELSRSLDSNAVPSVVLYDAGGKLIGTGIQALDHVVTYAPEKTTGEQLIRRVGAGEAVAPIGDPQQYYPGDQLIGSCAPAFTLPELRTGKDLEFRVPLRRSTLVVFWSSTCKHCQKEIPKLVEHQAAHRNDYDIVSVSQIKPDKKDGISHRKVSLAYIENQKIAWPVLEDPGGVVSDLYGVVSTPTTFVVAQSGEVVDAWYFGHSDLDGAVAKALGRARSVQGKCRPLTPRPAARAQLGLTTPGGEETQLSALLGRPTLVHFWATWCKPCEAELPSLLGFRDAFEADGGRVVMVAVQEADQRDAVRRFAEERGLRMKSHLAPRGGLADRVDLAYSVPRTYLVSAGGGVVDVRYGDQKWDEPDFRKRVTYTLRNAR